MTDYQYIASDLQSSLTKMTEDRDYWKSQAQNWRSLAESMHSHCREAILLLGDVMLDWDQK